MSEQERLRRLFRELHADDPPAPAYRSLAAVIPEDRSPAAAPTRPVRPRLVARVAWAAAAAVAAGALLLALSRRERPAPGQDEMLRLAASLSDWEAPTDFLLSTPGADFLQSAPRLGTDTETLSGDRTDLLQNDFNEMEVFE